MKINLWRLKAQSTDELNEHHVAEEEVETFSFPSCLEVKLKYYINSTKMEQFKSRKRAQKAPPLLSKTNCSVDFEEAKSAFGQWSQSQIVTEICYRSRHSINVSHAAEI